MRQIVQSPRTGKLELLEVPTPALAIKRCETQGDLFRPVLEMVQSLPNPSAAG